MINDIARRIISDPATVGRLGAERAQSRERTASGWLGAIAAHQPSSIMDLPCGIPEAWAWMPIPDFIWLAISVICYENLGESLADTLTSSPHPPAHEALNVS